MKKIYLLQFIILLIGSLGLLNCKNSAPEPAPKPDPKPDITWTNLLDKDLSNWDKFIGVPHFTVDLPGYDKGDGIKGTPVGLNNDPLQVFKIEEENGKPVLHISGEIYGGLSTKQEYGNYHFKAEFKWGNKKYEPRLNQKRDNGILYHAKGDHGAFWNAWMLSQEMQVQEADMGDYFALGPEMDIKATHKTVEDETEWIYDPAAPLESFGDGGVGHRCRRRKNMEKPHGEWNTLEIICLGPKSLHIVNGEVVMVLENSRNNLPNNTSEPLTSGKIQIQSEAAEAFYRNIQIRPITEIPTEYQ